LLWGATFLLSDGVGRDPCEWVWIAPSRRLVLSLSGIFDGRCLNDPVKRRVDRRIDALTCHCRFLARKKRIADITVMR
jgi:hypothetical protein